MSAEFHGRGISFPFELSQTGGVREAVGVDKIEESIRVLLGTQHGERVMRPTFGCNLRSLVFDPLNVATLNLARHYVEEGLREGEPRIDLIDVHVDADRGDNARGMLVIHVNYRIKATQETRSLVHPFYLESA
jgi:hypothetical protein